MSRNFEPVHEVTMYQARCTNCGTVEDDYGDHYAWSDDGTPIEQVSEFRGWYDTLTDRYADGELLCPSCQKCEVCGVTPATNVEGDHLRCEDHEDVDAGVVS